MFTVLVFEVPGFPSPPCKFLLSSFAFSHIDSPPSSTHSPTCFCSSCRVQVSARLLCPQHPHPPHILGAEVPALPEITRLGTWVCCLAGLAGCQEHGGCEAMAELVRALSSWEKVASGRRWPRRTDPIASTFGSLWMPRPWHHPRIAGWLARGSEAGG